MVAKRIPASVRRSSILTEVHNSGHALVGEIAERLGVSEMTVRRDMDELAANGQVVRTHGGASVSNSTANGANYTEPSVEARATKNLLEKQAISRAALQLIKPNSTIALDIGTTNWELARLLSDVTVRVVTNSMIIPPLLSGKQMDVYVPAGRVSGTEPSIVGAQTIEHLQGFFFDTVFIGVSGITEDGLFDYSFEDSEIKKTLISRASNVVVLADHSKIQQRSAVKICSLGKVNTIVTDSDIDEVFANTLRNNGIEVIVA